MGWDPPLPGRHVETKSLKLSADERVCGISEKEKKSLEYFSKTPAPRPILFGAYSSASAYHLCGFSEDMAGAAETMAILLKCLPTGFRFHPTHEESINRYLMPKVLGFNDSTCIIPDVDILMYEPWQLPDLVREKSIIPSDDNHVWWFFSLQTETQRVRRTTHSGSGFWKKTGDDLKIKARDSNRVIGTKKTLVFHEGSSSTAIKTNWVIHEFHAHASELDEFVPASMRKNYVLCRLKHKQDKKADISEEREQPASFSESEIQAKMRSLMMPSVEPPGQAQITSSDLRRLFPYSMRSGRNVSFNLQRRSQTSQQTGEMATSLGLQGFFQPSPQSGDSTTVNLQDRSQPSQQSEFNVPFNLLQQLHQPSQRSEANPVELLEQFYLPQQQLNQSSFQSENSRGSSNLQSSIRMPLDGGFTVTDESNQLDTPFANSEDDEDGEFFNPVLTNSDFFGGDQMQMEFDQTSSSHTERAVIMENRRAQTTDTIHGVIPLDEKEGFVKSKQNSRHAPPAKPMAPQKKATNDVRAAGRDAQKVVKHEPTATRIKQERASLDESPLQPKVVEINKQRGATVSSQKTSLKETRQDGIVPQREEESTCEDPLKRMLNFRNVLIGIVLLITVTSQVFGF